MWNVCTCMMSSASASPPSLSVSLPCPPPTLSPSLSPSHPPSPLPSPQKPDLYRAANSESRGVILGRVSGCCGPPATLWGECPTCSYGDQRERVCCSRGCGWTVHIRGPKVQDVCVLVSYCVDHVHCTCSAT